ncbi:ABC transporter [Desulfuromusa kysingii]|uniref:ABC transporter n=2 Tax=Desulfuromusa kysingii TaxID=37625 RepID=A0A1H4CWN3_9BACT|nr:ABC transporter [Desulfuromusa kysingii]
MKSASSIKTYWDNILFLQVYRLCSPALRKRFHLLCVAMLLLAVGETAVVGLIAFYAAAVSDPQATFNLATLETLRSFSVLAPILSSPKQMIGCLSVLVIIAVPLKNAFRGFITYRSARYGAVLEAYFGQQILSGILARDYRWHVQQNSADLVNLANWRHHLGRFFVNPYLKVICELSMLMVLLAGLLLVQPLVSLLFIGAQGGAGFLVYRGLRRGLDRSATGCRSCDIDMNRQITRSIHGVKDVKITASAPFFVRKFVLSAQRFAQMFGSQQFWRESPLLVLESIGFVLIAGAILLMLFGLGYSPLQTTGTTALLAVTAWRTLPAFNRVVASLAGIRTARPYVISLLEELNSRAQSHRSAGVPVLAMPFNRHVVFDQVSFAYTPQQPVLENFNLTLKKGQSLGIMGPSGCGKSTMVDLMCGLLQPQSGTISVDGVVLTEDNLPSWRQNIGYVPQTPYIFDGTLAENVAFGLEAQEIDLERVASACAMARIDFLDQLPQKFATQIGERGIRLSGGQRQRVAIARALYRQPQLLIFDEATSALDEDTDAEIRQLLLSLKGKQTLIVVSHRPSTVADCDMLLKLGQG